MRRNPLLVRISTAPLCSEGFRLESVVLRSPNDFVLRVSFKILEPTPKAVRLPVGTPWFLTARAPLNAIVGGGFLAHYTEMPLYLAWDTVPPRKHSDGPRQYVIAGISGF